MSTPIIGPRWQDTDHGTAFPRFDVFATWCEIREVSGDSPVPSVYVAAVSPRGYTDDDQLIQGYLPVDLAEHLRDSLTTAIDDARLTLSANHHMLCDCGDERD